MTALRGQNSKCGVHTVSANKHVDAFDMCFKLIGLPTRVEAIKLNYGGPEALFFPSRLVFTDVNQAFLSKITTL